LGWRRWRPWVLLPPALDAAALVARRAAASVDLREGWAPP